MEKVKVEIGSKHKETLDELGYSIKAHTWGKIDFIYNERARAGRCFVTNQGINGCINDMVIRVESKDSKGMPIVERYNVSGVGFSHMMRRVASYNEWKGF